MYVFSKQTTVELLALLKTFWQYLFLIYTRRMTGFIKQSAQKNSAIEIIPVHDQKECIL